MVDKKKYNLGPTKEDFIASASRALAGLVPGGSFLAELITYTIPNQRIDRFAEVLTILLQDFEDIKEDIKDRLNNPENRDLFEEAGIQSGRAVTHDRKLYIANMLKNGLRNTGNTYVEKKKLFSLLENLNELEIIYLKLISFESILERYEQHYDDRYKMAIMDVKSRKETFCQKHSELFQNRFGKNGGTFYSSYMLSLEKNGLIERDEEITMLGNIPKYRITVLGELFLQYIEVPED